MTPYREVPSREARDASRPTATLERLTIAGLALSLSVPSVVVAFVALLVVFGEAAMWGVFPVLLLIILAFALGMRESDRVWDEEEDRVARVLHESDD